MKLIHQSYLIHAPLEEVWQALVNPTYIEGWGGGPAKMDGKVGTKFTLWGGDIHGKNTEVIPHKKLVQEWYGGNWDKPSTATFELQQEGDNVRIDFTHLNVPEGDFKNIEQGWKDYYLGPLKDFLEKK